MSAKGSICMMCERPCEVDFCTEACKHLYERGEFRCPTCNAYVGIKDKREHERVGCITVQMKRLKGEIRGKERELEELAQRLEVSKE